MEFVLVLGEVVLPRKWQFLGSCPPEEKNAIERRRAVFKQQEFY